MLCLHVTRSLSYNHKSSFCPNSESIFIDIFCLNQSQFLQACYIKHLPNPDLKSVFIIFRRNQICYIGECYLISGFNVNVLSEKMLLEKQYFDSTARPHPLIKKCIDLYFYHFLYYLLVEPKSKTKCTETLIDHIVTNFPEKGYSEWCYLNLTI